VEWLGEVPEYWQTWKISHAFGQIGSGTTPDTKDLQFYGGDIPWVTTSELRENIIKDTSEKLTQAALEEYSTLSLYPPGTLLIAMYGATIGRLGILGIAACTNQACCALAKPKQLDTKFCFYWLWMRRNEIILLSSGGGQPNINQQKIYSIRIPAPSLQEQKLIAQFLDRETTRIDTLITKKRELINLLEKKRNAVIANAVTKGLDPNTSMKNSNVAWLGEIPIHWKTPALCHVCRLTAGGTPDRNNQDYWNGDIPWVKTGEVNYNKINETEEYISDLGLRNSSAKLAPPGTLLMAMYGQGITRGRVAILGIEVAFNQACLAISPYKFLDVNYLYYYLVNAYTYIRELGNLSSQMNLSLGFIAKIRVLLPPIEEQKAIVSFLDQVTSHIEDSNKKLQTSIEELEKYRQALITAAVTGKIDVREEVKRGTA
jgi:restriction endonuclease S subunit